MLIQGLVVGFERFIARAQGVHKLNIGRLSGRRPDTVRLFRDLYESLSIVSARFWAIGRGSPSDARPAAKRRVSRRPLDR